MSEIKIIKTYISKYGYVLKKEHFDRDTIEKTKSILTARPLQDSKFSFNILNNDNCFPVYIETNNKLYIPRDYGMSTFGLPDKYLPSYFGQDTNKKLTFTGELRPHQLEAYDVLFKSCQNENRGGVFHVGTGVGKTVMSIKLIAEMSVKTLVIVNKIPLMQQWEKEISQFIPSAKIGFIQGQKNIDIHGKDVVIAMLQSLAKIDYPDKLFEDFKMVIVDETHNISSKVFSRIFFKICCPYMIGLSATPERADGLSYVFKWHMGDIIYQTKIENKGLNPIIHLVKIQSSEFKEHRLVNRFTGQEQIQFTTMLSDLIQIPNRNHLIVHMIHNCIKEKRRILVLSDRRQHLQDLYRLLSDNTDCSFTFGLFLGQMKIKDLEQSKKADVILATYKAFGEGVSEKDLDTLILTTPKKYIGHLKHNLTAKKEAGALEQIVGRIFRKEHTERHPLIIDLQDDFSIFKSQAAQRRAFYNKHFECKIINYHVNIDESTMIDETNRDKTTLVNTKSKISSVDSVDYTECLLD